MQHAIPGSAHGRNILPQAAVNADYWRRRADETLEVAYELRDPVAISKMLEIGRRYERLARQAEQRQR